jgi:hypothetical protein
MKYYKIISANGSSRFAVEQEEGLLADLTSVDENLSGLEVIARPVVSAINMIFATAVLVINLMIDAIYAFLDPRVRYE